MLLNIFFNSIKGEISERKRVVDVKKGPVKKTVAIGCLPELTKSKCKTPSPRNTKTKRVKGESKVGNVSPKSKFEMQNSNKPIKIIVTYETQRTCVTEKTNSEKPSSTVTTTPTTTAARAFEEEKKSSESNKSESFRSADEVYEDDFEGSDLDKQDEKKVGYLTTRV